MRDIREQVEAAPVVKLVNGVLARAADEGASDIHFEPQARDLLIRFRHDGVLHEIMTIPKTTAGRGHLSSEDHGRPRHR